MLIREYTEADLDALRRMHARQGFDYPFPNLADPIFVSKLVVEDDSGRAVMASLARLTCEMYLLVERDYESSATSHGVISGFGSPMDSTGVLKSDPSPDAMFADGGEGSACVLPTPKQQQIPRHRPDTGRPRNDSVTGRGAAARQRYEWLLALHAAGERDLLARGLDDAHAWLPPPIAKRFGRRLEALGWVRDDSWTPYCRRLRSP
jgi:hypothetical protein